MVFSSIIFIFYFLPLFFLAYYLSGEKYKNIVILAGSMLFYAWGAPRFIFVILGTTIADFYIVKAMHSSEDDRRRKRLLHLSLAINLGLLFYFKYCNFFVDNINQLFAATMGIKPVSWTKIILPIGISFYTFETLTYVVDIYKRIQAPARNFWDYQLYIILFPKLIAGPIIPYHDIADQIYDHTKHETYDNRLRGFYRFCIGLGKKVLIADAIGSAADAIFAIPNHELGTSTAWFGALSYAFQIYFDFSGYSDMAIGMGLMMGFRFPENFNNPYTAVSITDFWRRWHITLGNWMRNYLYIPLGGNRVSNKWRLYFNLWIVFLASGLWHGAAWGYIIWGAYHGAFLVLERLFLGKWLAKFGKAACIYTFAVVTVGWVFFKTEHLHPSLNYLHRMFSWSQSTNAWRPDLSFYFALGLAAFFSFFTVTKVGESIQQKFYFAPYSLKRHYAVSFVVILLLVIATSRITTYNFNAFIYFRF